MSKCTALLGICNSVVGTFRRRNTPLLMRMTSAVDGLEVGDRALLLKTLDQCLDNSGYQYHEDSSLGVLDSQRQVRATFT